MCAKINDNYASYQLLKKLDMVLRSETSRGGLSLFFLTMRFSVRSFSIFNDAFFNVIF